MKNNCICALLLILAVSAVLSGQPRSRGHGAQAEGSRVVTDDIAYGHFFMMLAPPPAAAEIQNPESGSVAERQTAYIMHVGLNAQQGEVLIRVAGKYYDYLARLQAQATQIAGAAVPSGVRLTASQLDKLKAISSGRRAFLLQLIWDLHQELDDQGDRILRQYIDQQVRPNVRFR